MSIQLGNAIVNKLQAAFPDSTVKITDLLKKNFPHLEEAHIASFFTPEEARTPENLEAIKHSEQSIQEIKDADIIVIGAPLYNFSIHSVLKAWVDHITRAGITFKYDENGIQGLIKDKKVYLAISSGGVYSEGPMKAMDFVEPYMRTILSSLGMTDITVFRVEGLSIPGIQETALEKGIDSITI
jgi:FMN-dependent NADH-azoreductase